MMIALGLVLGFVALVGFDLQNYKSDIKYDPYEEVCNVGGFTLWLAAFSFAVAIALNIGMERFSLEFLFPMAIAMTLGSSIIAIRRDLKKSKIFSC